MARALASRHNAPQISQTHSATQPVVRGAPSSSPVNCPAPGRRAHSPGSDAWRKDGQDSLNISRPAGMGKGPVRWAASLRLG